ENDVGLGLSFTQLAEEVVAGHVRESNIGDDGVVGAEPGHGDGFVAIAGGVNDAAEATQEAVGAFADTLVVVGDENAHALETRPLRLGLAGHGFAWRHLLADFLY